MIDIVIRSYFRDFSWLKVCLASIDYYLRGYERVIVVIPRSSDARLPPWASRTSSRVTWMICEDEDDDYIGQQITKLYADQYSSARWIAHVDSDCVFDRPCDLREVLLSGDKCVLRYRRTTARGEREGWRQCVTNFFGDPSDVDFLTPFPIAFPRPHYAKLREVCRHRHGCGIETWARHQRADTMSEFNLLGALAWQKSDPSFQPTCIDDHDPAAWPCRHYWSRGGITPAVRASFPVLA